MQNSHFDCLSNLLKTRSGLVLTPEKTYLLESRLGPVATKWGLASVEALADEVRRNTKPDLITAVVEAMTTNESSFFRDKTPFDQFTAIMLPALRKARTGQKRITIWSAASSSGQEAYSLALLLKEHEAEFAGWKFDILGTDLSVEMVERSREGLYSHFEAQRGLPARLLVKYFKQEGTQWRLDESVRRMVRFQQLNLLGNPGVPGYGTLGTFDIVFCRNVLIYFDQAAKRDVLDRLKHHMLPESYLVLGGAETVLGLSSMFTSDREQKGLYTIIGKSTPAAIAPDRSASSYAR